ncbi:Uncharacterized protein HZ326_7356 [Fusarium oxysporum f. sp. albedinis]|nr:Uncharacterized protein HZ326_7356 [Fusarium oxysporum f. sp. albedinis]
MSRTCSLYASMSGPMKTFRDSRVYTAVPLQTVEPISTQALGEPAARIFINLLDFSATLVSVGCFAAAALVINPNHYAAKLGFYNQIIILGFLISLQFICLQCIFPFVLTLMNAKFGIFTLQDIEGLLRSSPFTSRVGQFTVGSAYSSEKVSVGTYGPTAPQGLQNNVAENMLHSTSASKINALFASATIPFMPQTSDEVAFPLYLDGQPKPFGFSSILISNTSAAAIDAPLPNHFLDLQKDLKAVEAYFLSANKLRGTVVNNNPTIQDAGYGRRSLPSHKQGYALSKCH